MKIRIYLARFLLNLGEFISSLPVVIMKPEDLVEFSFQSYSKVESINTLADKSLVDSGLSDDELDLLAQTSGMSGKFLLLGVGGGREAIPFAEKGYEITAVDFVTELVNRAKEHAAQRGVHIEGLVQEISQLDIPQNTYDIVWLSRSMYSCVPTRARRIQMVKRISRALKPGGFFLCQFHWDPKSQPSKKGVVLRRVIAAFTLGNIAYQAGDMLWGNNEFVHAFSTENEIQSELEEGGLSIIYIQTSRPFFRAGAVSMKK